MTYGPCFVHPGDGVDLQGAHDGVGGVEVVVHEQQRVRDSQELRDHLGANLRFSAGKYGVDHPQVDLERNFNRWYTTYKHKNVIKHLKTIQFNLNRTFK